MLETIRIELISQHYNDSFRGHFDIGKTKTLIGRKYYWPSMQKDDKAYIKGCNVYLSSKTIRHKPYSELQTLPIPTY